MEKEAEKKQGDNAREETKEERGEGGRNAIQGKRVYRRERKMD